MNEIRFCFIKESCYKEHPDIINVLDVGDSVKQSKRTHLCILIKLNNNQILIPLRNNLGKPLRKFGKIGFAVPSEKRPNAGLDYRYSLIINNNQYLEFHDSQKLPNSQYNIIANNYSTIKSEITVYINRYIKVAKKNRILKEPLFRTSSLINFHKELNIPQN